jgi:hypothetical protein
MVIMDLKKALKSVAKLMVEMPPEAPTPPTKPEEQESSPAKQVLFDPAAPPPAEERSCTTAQPFKAPDANGLPPFHGSLDPKDKAAIYQWADVPVISFNAEQLLEFVAALPADLPLHSKRRMLHVTLEALSKNIPIQPDDVINDASRKIIALKDYADERIRLSSERADALRKEIAQFRTWLEERQRELKEIEDLEQQVTQQCTAGVAELEQVIYFFESDVPEPTARQ